MPRVSNQLLLFTYVSPFCLFKTASSPWTCHSPQNGNPRWILGAGAAGGRQNSRSSSALLPCCPLTAQRELLLPECLERIHWIARAGNQCNGAGLTVLWDPQFHLSFSDKFLDQMQVTDFSALTFSCPCWTSQDVQSRSQVPADTPDLALIPIVWCASGGLD